MVKAACVHTATQNPTASEKTHNPATKPDFGITLTSDIEHFMSVWWLAEKDLQDRPWDGAIEPERKQIFTRFSMVEACARQRLLAAIDEQVRLGAR